MDPTIVVALISAAGAIIAAIILILPHLCKKKKKKKKKVDDTTSPSRSATTDPNSSMGVHRPPLSAPAPEPGRLNLVPIEGAGVVRQFGTLPDFENSIGMKFVLIPAGTFLMGSPDDEKNRSKDEGPQHKVEITRPFYLGVFQVTQEQYQKVMDTNPSHFTSERGGTPNHPSSGCPGRK